MKRNNILHKRLAASVFVFLLAVISLIGSIPASADYYLTTTVVNVNSSPIAENMSIKTYRGVSVSGMFEAIDPEGDMITYTIAKEPKKGSVVINGDTFTYTPADGKKGKDSFSYVAVDAVGNVSKEATVTIEIKKKSSEITYSDISGSGIEYAATVLAEEGIFIGEQLGNQYFFRPDTEVTRGEFLAMCIDLCGTDLLEGIVRTGFYDDESIPVWQKSYVATGLMEDIISGTRNDEGKLVFSSDTTITFAEASVMLNNAMHVTDVSIDEEYESTYPSWACQAAANLSSCNVVTNFEYSAKMTRADAASMLVNALDIINSRSSASTLWSWAK